VNKETNLNTVYFDSLKELVKSVNAEPRYNAIHSFNERQDLETLAEVNNLEDIQYAFPQLMV
jgi:hypothetical protein